MPTFIAEHWHVWLVTGALIWAAVIDGIELRVPNAITFPFIISGWIYSTVAFGWEGLGWEPARNRCRFSIVAAPPTRSAEWRG